ncbi:MAG: glycosyltransferase, partial [Acidobacteria bacterium]|nr:glycosyltransferase [Acidobacteriota bacterium]
TRVVCDWHNIESELMSRYAERESNLAKKLVAKRTAQLLRRTEIELLRTCPAHTVASEREREELLRTVPGARVEVIPNGIDVAHFSVAGGDAEPRKSLLFVGSMDYHANIDAVQWFAAEGWGPLSARHSDMEFVVVGRSPHASVRALAGGRLRVTGTVDDVRPYYGQAFAVAVPLRVGSGTRLKILEAMAAGVPVVSTRLGAEGIDAEHGRDILIADTPAEMVDALSLLYRDAELRARLSQGGRKLVADHYDWPAIGAKLVALHREIGG